MLISERPYRSINNLKTGFRRDGGELKQFSANFFQLTGFSSYARFFQVLE
jgi:hypothetical protein